MQLIKYFTGFINSVSIARLQVALSAGSVLLSFYLAYLLYFVLDDFCIVCVSTYVVNFACLYLSYGRQKSLNVVAVKEKRRMKPKKSQ